MTKVLLTHGFTFIELILVMGIFSLIAALFSVNYFSATQSANIDAAYAVLVADLNTQQSRAISGEGVNGSQVAGWGLRVNEASYTLIPDNKSTTLNTDLRIATTFPDSQVIFARGSGEIISFIPDQNTITLNLGDKSKVVRLNKYGVIVGD